MVGNIILVLVQITQYFILIVEADEVEFWNYVPNIAVLGYQVFYVVTYVKRDKDG